MGTRAFLERAALKKKSHPSEPRPQSPLFTGRGRLWKRPHPYVFIRSFWDTAPFHAARTAQGRARAEAASRARREGRALERGHTATPPGRRTLRPHRHRHPRPPGLGAPGPQGRHGSSHSYNSPQRGRGRLWDAPPRARPRSAPALPWPCPPPPRRSPAVPPRYQRAPLFSRSLATLRALRCSHRDKSHLLQRGHREPSCCCCRPCLSGSPARTEQNRARLFCALCPTRLPGTSDSRGSRCTEWLRVAQG